MLDTIQAASVRIVITLAGSSDTFGIALSAAQKGMMVRGWCWISTDWLPGSEKAGSASEVPMVKASLHGWLYIVAAVPDSPNRAAFRSSVAAYGRSHFNLTLSAADDINDGFASALYDAVYLFAHAASRVLLEGGEIDDGAAAVRAMRNLSFEGVLGQTVELDEHGDRIEAYSVMNYVESGGLMRGIAVLRDDGVQLACTGERVLWPGNSTDIPTDGMPLCSHSVQQYCGPAQSVTSLSQMWIMSLEQM